MNVTIKNRVGKEQPVCIWMQAGVIRKKPCFQEFQCTTCQFNKALLRVCRQNQLLKDQGLVPEGKKGQFIYWKDNLKRQPKSRQPCIHQMKGRISLRACYRDYQCDKCEFDQFFYDQYSVYAIVKQIGFMDIHGIKLPTGYYIHPGHTWVKVEGDNHVRIGIDDFALRLLGYLDKIEAPLMGSEIHQGRQEITVTRTDHKARFASPVSGIITAINPKLRQQGDHANQDPYTHGWIMLVHSPHLKTDLKNLMFMSEAEEYITNEIDALYRILEEKTGLMAADGGTLGYDIFGNAPGITWESLVNQFIKRVA